MIIDNDIHVFLYIDKKDYINTYYESLKNLRKENHSMWITSYSTNEDYICCGMGENSFLYFNKNKLNEVFFNHINLVNKKITVFKKCTDVINYNDLKKDIEKMISSDKYYLFDEDVVGNNNYNIYITSKIIKESIDV